MSEPLGYLLSQTFHIDAATLVTDDGLAVRIVMTRAQAMAFCVHTARVVEAGRPNCDYCGLPVNPDGGLKSFGHPVGASGLRMMFEAWLQLRGEAGEAGERDGRHGPT